MTFRKALKIIMGALRGQKPKRRRICIACGQQIKRAERWSAKNADKRPKHWICPEQGGEEPAKPEAQAVV